MATRVRRQQPRLLVNYDALVEDIWGQVTASDLGVLLRGLAWAGKAGKQFMPRTVFECFGDGADADATVERLVAAGFLTPAEHPRYMDFGPALWNLLAPVRQPIPCRVREAVLTRDGHVCRRCSTADRLTIDHIKPVSRGGTNDISNLQVLCHPCNSRKGDRD